MKGKKIVAIGLALVLALGMSACSGNVSSATDPIESGDVSQAPDASTTQVVDEATKNPVETEEGTGTEVDTEEPGKTEEPGVEETPKTEGGTTPAPTEKPVETQKPAEVEKPVETQKPTEPEKPAHTHNYTSSVTKEACCEVNGVRTYKCSCGDSYTESISATGHTYDNGQVVKNATCTEAGSKLFTCTKCGAVYTEVIPAGSHNWVTQEGTGHMEQVQVGTEQVLVRNEKRQYNKCLVCNGIQYTDEEMRGHSDPSSPYYHPGCEFSRGLIYTEYVPIYEEQPVYENRWVEDTPATTVCSICGKQQ